MAVKKIILLLTFVLIMINLNILVLQEFVELTQTTELSFCETIKKELYMVCYEKGKINMYRVVTGVCTQKST